MGFGNSKDRRPNNIQRYNQIRAITLEIEPPSNKNKSLSYEEVERKIETITGFKSYHSLSIKLNKTKKKIDGMYFQNDRGCILYSLINEGWIDEKYIPDSMKFYKNHTYSEDNKNYKYSLLIKLLSRLDLAHLWTNLGGLSPYVEIDVEEAKRRIFNIIGRFFISDNKEELKKAYQMSTQKINYYTIIGELNVRIIRLKDIDKIKNNPTIKNAIDSEIIKSEDILVVGDHFFCYNGKVNENGAEAYSFKDSISNYYKTKKDEVLRKSNCIIYDNKGIVNAFNNCLLVNTKDDEKQQIGKLEIIDN